VVADFDGRSGSFVDDADPPALDEAVSLDPDVDDDADVELSLEPPSFVVVFDPSPLSDDEPSWLDLEVPGLDVARRSFLAQPVPLKWIAGAANAFLTGPPSHSGHVVGSSAWTPRRTSNRLPQFAQS
jgi:hypothetical protein